METHNTDRKLTFKKKTKLLVRIEEIKFLLHPNIRKFPSTM